MKTLQGDFTSAYLAKLFEKFFIKILSEIVESAEIISNYQFGFRSNFTESLELYVWLWKESELFLHVNQAFDKVDSIA